MNPDMIPWKALRAILGESVYGGKVDNTFDAGLLKYGPDAACEMALITRWALHRVELLLLSLLALKHRFDNATTVCMSMVTTARCWVSCSSRRASASTSR